jgi:cytochrome c peroxidase
MVLTKKELLLRRFIFLFSSNLYQFYQTRKLNTMFSKQLRVSATLVCLTLLCQYCSKEDTSQPSNTESTSTTPVLPSIPYNYLVNLPANIANNLLQTDNTPDNNAITNDGATLGRVLFYDKRLSLNNTISCASCHKQTLSFSDTALRSVGFAGGLTRRHSMPLLNIGFYQTGKMFWDERASSLEEQTLMPIQDLTEMGMTLPALVNKLDTVAFYPALFQKAFGSSTISTDAISKALSQFVRSIITFQSKYDLVKAGKASFTAEESAGEQLFLTAGVNTCASCHTPPMFITSNPKAPFALRDDSDLGINNEDRFKSSSLRNIALTAPYFHNGSIGSLQSMLTSRIPDHGVAAQDVSKLLTFLQTLSDNTITTEARFSNPFN